MNKQIGIIATLIPLLLTGNGDKIPYKKFDEVLSLESLESVTGKIDRKELLKFEEIEVEVEPIEEITSQYNHLEKTYRQTYYSVEQGEVSLGSGYNQYSNEVKNIKEWQL